MPPDEALVEASAKITAILEQNRAGSPIIPIPRKISESISAPNTVEFWHFSHPLISPVFSDLLRMQDAGKGPPSFREAYPNIAIEQQYLGEWHYAVQKLTVTIAAGDPPDVALVKRAWLAPLIYAGRAAPLDDLLPPDVLARLHPRAREAYTVDGRLYGLPADGFCSVLYINPNFVREAPKTWTELRDSANALKTSEAFASSGLNAPIGYMPFMEALWSTGGEVCDARRSMLDSSPAHEALDFLLALQTDGLATRFAALDPMRGFDLFLKGKVAMTVGPSEWLPVARKSGIDFTIAPVPGKSGPMSALSDTALVVFAERATERRVAIAALLAYLLGPEVQGSTPQEHGSATLLVPVDTLPPSEDALADAFAHARGAPLIAPWGEIESQLYRHLARAYLWRPEENRP